MSWLLSLLLAVITGIVGLLTSGFVAGAYASWYHMSTREGAAGFFVLGVALLGGIVSAILGLVVARIVAANADPSFAKAFAFSVGPVLALGGVLAAVFYCLADFPPTIRGETLRLAVEIRLAADVTQAPSELKGEPRFTLGSIVNHRQRASESGTLKVALARQEKGRWIVPAEVFLFTSRGLRGIDAAVGEKSLAGFLVPLPAHPGSEYETWSDWMPHPRPGDPPWPETNAAFRFRVERIPPPPPPPTAEEQAAAQEAAEQAEFDALPADAPLTAWLPYTPEWRGEKRRAAAMERITQKATFLPELGALMLADDPRQAEAALRFIPLLQQPDGVLLPPVTAAGREIIERMKKVNATTAEQDPSYEGAADVSIRFSAWMAAVRALREKAGGDFTTELREMLELSRVRTDSHAMQQDVRRVASYYMKEWTGAAPAPGDPPPK